MNTAAACKGSLPHRYTQNVFFPALKNNQSPNVFKPAVQIAKIRTMEIQIFKYASAFGFFSIFPSRIENKTPGINPINPLDIVINGIHAPCGAMICPSTSPVSPTTRPIQGPKNTPDRKIGK